MSSLLYRTGFHAASRPLRVIAAWLAVAVVVVVGSSAFGRDLDDAFTAPGLDSDRATELLSSAQSDQAGLTARVVASPADDSSSLQAIRAELAGLPDVVGVADPVVAADESVAIITVQYPVLEDLDVATLDALKDTVANLDRSTPLQVEAGGDLFFALDEPQTGGGEMIGLVAAAVILLLAFGSLIAMGLPIGLAIFGLVLGVSAMSLITYVVEIPAWAPEIGAMIGLGVGIDYALFLVTRHRELLADGVPVAEAAGFAVATAGKAVVFAGGTVVIAILGLAVSGVPFIAAAGLAISVIVAIMVLASVTLLPAFLGLAGSWINRLGIHRRGASASVGASPRWTRWGRHVSAHAWAYTIGTTVLLLALTAPVLKLQLGFPDEGTSAPSTTQRRAYDLVAEGFGSGANGPMLIAVDMNGDVGIISSLAAAIDADPGVAGIEPSWVDQVSDVATIVAYPTTAPQDDATVETISRLRSQVFPSVLDSSDATAHIGGQTATFSDVAQRVSDRLPLFILAVILLSFALLVVLFRSILVPLKAAILNLLSIGSAYGVLVMVFQWGWGKQLFGLEGPVPIVSFIPMFMFAILFGLSMDYEVFLLSRVREHYLDTGDNDSAVIHGIASTARVITSAALIMISVFGAFVLAEDPTMKMFGLGLATAILVDATIVRVVLVPATMKLLGDANWWFPQSLDRFLPTVDLEGAPAQASPVDDPALTV